MLRRTAALAKREGADCHLIKISLGCHASCSLPTPGLRNAQERKAEEKHRQEPAAAFNSCQVHFGSRLGNKLYLYIYIDCVCVQLLQPGVQSVGHPEWRQKVHPGLLMTQTTLGVPLDSHPNVPFILFNADRRSDHFLLSPSLSVTPEMHALTVNHLSHTSAKADTSKFPTVLTLRGSYSAELGWNHWNVLFLLYKQSAHFNLRPLT